MKTYSRKYGRICFYRHAKLFLSGRGGTLCSLFSNISYVRFQSQFLVAVQGISAPRLNEFLKKVRISSKLSEIWVSHEGEDDDCGALGWTSTLKMDGICSSETLVTTYKITRCQNHNHQ
jgi:hypothetical protein